MGGCDKQIPSSALPTLPPATGSYSNGVFPDKKKYNRQAIHETEEIFTGTDHQVSQRGQG
jgi:hypothetical protein